jgi:hypothetical protein
MQAPLGGHAPKGAGPNVGLLHTKMSAAVAASEVILTQNVYHISLFDHPKIYDILPQKS